MKIGQPGDSRKFRSLKKGQEGVTHDVPDLVTKWPICVTCRETIQVGRKWRVEEGKYSCTRCHNENVKPSDQGDFLDADFSWRDFW